MQKLETRACGRRQCATYVHPKILFEEGPLVRHGTGLAGALPHRQLIKRLYARCA